MFARITQFQMKPGTKEQATALMHSLKDEIMGMPGMHSFTNVMNDDGSGYVVAVVESEESSNANAEKVAALWSHFADFMAAPPQPAGFDVVAHWNR